MSKIIDRKYYEPISLRYSLGAWFKNMALRRSLKKRDWKQLIHVSLEDFKQKEIFTPRLKTAPRIAKKIIEFCQTCKKCEASCASDAITFSSNGKELHLNLMKCDSCGDCISVCPENILEKSPAPNTFLPQDSISKNGKIKL